MWLVPALLLVPVVAGATVSSVRAKIRWVGEVPSAAKAGTEFVGRFEVVAAAPGALENVSIEGAGWTLSTLDAPSRSILSTGERRVFTFRGVPADEKAPLVVRCTYDGKPLSRTLRLDAASLAKAARPRPLAFVNGPPQAATPEGTPRVTGQTIRLRGRFVYTRADGVELGADNIVVRVRDDDSPDPFDETVWAGTTDINGNFDVVVNWNDCDAGGCDDPDLYVEFDAGGPLVDVQADDILETTYEWTSEDDPWDDYTGSDLDFGTMRPSDPAEYGAVHIYSSIIRAHRCGDMFGGMRPPLVDVQWPDDDWTSYSGYFEEIYVNPIHTWDEVVHAHEFMHHLEKTYGIHDEPDYGDAGHSLGCPLSDSDAWQEGVANWFGRMVAERYGLMYGIQPWAAGLDAVGNPNETLYGWDGIWLCDADNQAYDTSEGYVTAFLRDIEDANPTPPVWEDHDGDGAVDCDMDALGLGPDEILTVFRDDDPQDVFGFIHSFRLRYNEHDQNLWSTARNVTTRVGFSAPPPVVLSQPVPCIVAREGETLQLSVVGNGSLLKYQWRLNGFELFDDGVMFGTESPTLTFSPARAHMSGTYSCRVSTCSESLSVISLPVRVTILESSTPQPMLSWGANGLGQAGTGNLDAFPTPGVRALTDIVAVEGGSRHTAGLKSDGTVWTWGTPGNHVELGNGFSSATVTTPTQVADLDSVTQIATGDEYTLVLRRDGTVWGWGWNGFGNLGDSTQVSPARPTLAKEIEGCVKAISCGFSHSLALLDDGTVLAFGYNIFGQLGRGTTGGWSQQPLPVTGLSDVIAISSEGYSSMALKSDGTVWAWGWNQSGGLGIGTMTDTPVATQVVGLSNVRSICKGYRNGYAIKHDGTAWSWGENTYSMLGDGQSVSQITERLVPGLMPGLVNPVRIEATYGLFGVALMSNGTVRMWGYNDQHAFGAPTPNVVPAPWVIPGVGGVANIGTGHRTVFAFGAVSEDVVSAPEHAPPVALALRASPNPSFARTSIAFDLPVAGRVSLAVYDVAGRLVRSLVEGPREAGRFVEAWDGRSSSGSASLAGVYFVRLMANGRTLSERVVRMR